MTHRKYQDLFSEMTRLTRGTRTCLEGSIGRALFGRETDRGVLRSAVCRATRELRDQGLDAAATITVLAGMVEDGGRACRADRTSLLSGLPFWMAVRARVIESAENELAEPQEGGPIPAWLPTSSSTMLSSSRYPSAQGQPAPTAT